MPAVKRKRIHASFAGYFKMSSLWSPVCDGIMRDLVYTSLCTETQHLEMLIGPLGIFWDIENCPVPAGVRANEIAGNIRMALRVHPSVKGIVKVFSAYGDFNRFPLKLREGFQMTGVSLLDVPTTRKDASDKAILADMFLFAIDNPPPSTIFLISGDLDFAPALHKLGQRGYSIVLVVPTKTGLADSLCKAGQFVWDWHSLARGEGLVPAKVLCVPRMVEWDCRDVEHAGLNMNLAEHAGFNATVALDMHGEDFSLVHKHSPDLLQQSWPCAYNVPATSNTIHNGSFNGTVENSEQVEKNARNVVPISSEESILQYGNVERLKCELVKLLDLYGGELQLDRVRLEYFKVFGRQLYLAEYKSRKLIQLILKMKDTFCISCQGGKKIVSFRQGSDQSNPCIQQDSVYTVEKDHYKSDVAASPVVDINSDYNLKGNAVDENMCLSGWEARENLYLVDENIIADYNVCGTACVDHISGEYSQAMRLEVFKLELEELLVCHACKIPVTSFLTTYKQRYARELDLCALGVCNVRTLLDKMKDVAIIREEFGVKFILVRT
eukprot:c28463_g1_i4 orf=415-2073(+)